MKVINYIIAIIRLIFAMTDMALYYMFYRLLRPFKSDKQRWGLKMQQKYTTAALWAFGTHQSMEGKIPEDPVLYVSNHRSLLDPVVIIHYILAKTVAKAEVKNYPILGSAVQSTGVIFVKREDKNSRKDAKNAIVETLESGFSVLVFPEGTVSGETTTLPFHRGAFEKAVEAGVPVVPITLIYNDPKYHWFDMGTMEYFFNSFGRKTPNVHMIIGEPIPPTNPEEVMNRARAEIDRNLVKGVKFVNW